MERMATMKQRQRGKQPGNAPKKPVAKTSKSNAVGKASKAVAKANPAKARAPAKAAAKPAKAKTGASSSMRSSSMRSPSMRSSSSRSPSSSAGGAMFQKVAFTMFPVADFQRARAFYEEVLGLSRGLAADNGMWTEYDLPGGGCVALFCHPEFAGKPGGASIAFEVADLDGLNQRLQAAGVTYRGDVVHGPSCRMSNIVDSEGNGIILHQLNRKA